MNKAPAFQFYPKDWLEFKVQRMSLAAQGAYIKILCYMWNDSKDQCSILDDNDLISRAISTTVEQWLKLREEIQRENDPILQEKNGYLVSARLRHEATKQRKYRKTQSDKGKKSAQQRLNNGSTAVEPLYQPEGNPSSSSSSSKEKDKNKSQPEKPVASVEALRLAVTLREAIQERDSKAQAVIHDRTEAWARDIDKLIRIDKRAPGQIEAVIWWAQTKSDFWGPNILSGRKLREKFDQLVGQMNRNGGKQARAPDAYVGSNEAWSKKPEEPLTEEDWRELEEAEKRWAKEKGATA